jgi:hypothetical protein
MLALYFDHRNPDESRQSIIIGEYFRSRKRFNFSEDMEMNTRISKLFLALVLTVPGFASAESDVTTGAGTPITASARLDFRIIVPKLLYLKVGTGSTAPYADNATVDLVSFNYTTNPGDLGGGAGAPAGAITGNPVAVQVVGNNGTVTLTSTTAGALSNGSGDSISFTELSATTSNALLPHPGPFVDGGTSAGTALTPNIGTKVTNLTANWTYAYANTNVVPPGTYGGVNTNNSRVTYTASMP